MSSSPREQARSLRMCSLRSFVSLRWFALLVGVGCASAGLPSEYDRAVDELRSFLRAPRTTTYSLERLSPSGEWVAQSEVTFDSLSDGARISRVEVAESEPDRYYEVYGPERTFAVTLNGQEHQELHALEEGVSSEPLPPEPLLLTLSGAPVIGRSLTQIASGGRWLLEEESPDAAGRKRFLFSYVRSTAEKERGSTREGSMEVVIDQSRGWQTTYAAERYRFADGTVDDVVLEIDYPDGADGPALPLTVKQTWSNPETGAIDRERSRRWRLVESGPPPEPSDVYPLQVYGLPSAFGEEKSRPDGRSRVALVVVGLAVFGVACLLLARKRP